MSTTSGTAPLPVVEAVESWFGSRFSHLAAMNDDFCALLEHGSTEGDDVSRVARSNRDGLKKRVRRYLREHPWADGAGMIFTRSAEGGRGVIEWWERDSSHDVNRYSFGVDPTADRFYDYEKLEWFTKSFGAGSHWVTGPYIDYLGVDKYVMTLTVQSVVHGRPIGVAAVDLTMDDFERELLPVLREHPGPAALVTSHGSVLVSSTSRFVVGDLVGPLPPHFTSTTIASSGAPLALITGPSL
ncbi:cache domain-containing protein [Herbiconiux sp.]|uniref:cache domain-containing protein n=1 Tax=Herbiconiux sp. TaxID=1871186 RepID=UPI0025C72244|nr:cache domain-containing protein [Herbiconiux sp.]